MENNNIYSNPWTKGGEFYPNHIEESKEFWKENAKFILGERENQPLFEKNPMTNELITDEEIEAIKAVVGKVSSKNIYGQLKNFMEKITEVEFPELPKDDRLKANWEQMFKTWFFESNNEFINAYWQGNSKIVFNESSDYCLDIANSVSFSNGDNPNCIKRKFFKLNDEKRPNPFKANFSFVGPETGKENYYSWVEWFIGSFDCIINWTKNNDSSYDIIARLSNTSSWYSGTRLPKTWQDKLRMEIGIDMKNLVDSAERGQTIKRKLPSKVVSTLEYIGVVIPSFGGNWSQQFNVKANWE